MGRRQTSTYEFDPTQIRGYYDATIAYYRHFWHGSTGAVHYGFQDESTNGRQSELLNTNRVMAELASIDAQSHVLDAGCGVGGSAVWLAQNKGARVMGLSLSSRQLQEAARRALTGGVSHLCHFQRSDYTRAPFRDESFDVFWTLESSCYADDKLTLSTEAFRLLRPGGTFVVGDGFLNRMPETPDERREYDDFRRGLVLPELGDVASFKQALSAAGFENAESWDKTQSARPSAKRMHRMCLVAYPFTLLGRTFGLTSRVLRDNVRAGVAQYRMIRSGLIGYAVIRATKPSHSSP